LRNIGPTGDKPGTGDQTKEIDSSAWPVKPTANAAGGVAGMKAESEASAVSAAVEPSRIRRSAPETPPESRSKRWKWAFPVGIGLAGLAGLASVAAVLMRGCWHRNMSWPARIQEEHGEFSYQTCNDCGIMRLFDELAFRGYGPYGYDLHALIAHERLLRRQRMNEAARRKGASPKTAPPKPPETP
jgi:hypothetical protein